MANKKNVPVSVFGFLWYFSKKYKFRILLLFFVMFLSVVLVSYVSPYILKLFVNLYEARQLSLRVAMSLVIGYVMSLSIEPLLMILKSKLYLASKDLIKRDFLKYTFTDLLGKDMDYFNRNYSGDLTSKIVGLLNGYSTIFRAILNVANYMLFFIIGFAIIFNFSPYMCLMTIVWFIASYMSVKKSVTTRTARFKISSEEKGKSAGIINDCLMNISNIKSFSHEKIEIKNVKKQSLNIIRASGNTVGITSIVMFINYMIRASYYFIMVSFLFYLFKQGRVSLGDFVFMTQVITTMSKFVRNGLNTITKINPEIAKFQNSLDRIFVEAKIKDKAGARVLRVEGGRIVLRGVSFGYN